MEVNDTAYNDKIKIMRKKMDKAKDMLENIGQTTINDYSSVLLFSSSKIMKVKSNFNILSRHFSQLKISGKAEGLTYFEFRSLIDNAEKTFDYIEHTYNNSTVLGGDTNDTIQLIGDSISESLQSIEILQNKIKDINIKSLNNPNNKSIETEKIIKASKNKEKISKIKSNKIEEEKTEIIESSSKHITDFANKQIKNNEFWSWIFICLLAATPIIIFTLIIIFSPMIKIDHIMLYIPGGFISLSICSLLYLRVLANHKINNFLKIWAIEIEVIVPISSTMSGDDRNQFIKSSFSKLIGVSPIMMNNKDTNIMDIIDIVNKINPVSNK